MIKAYQLTQTVKITEKSNICITFLDLNFWAKVYFDKKCNFRYFWAKFTSRDAGQDLLRLLFERVDLTFWSKYDAII